MPEQTPNVPPRRAPAAHVDRANRLVTLTQPHPHLVGQSQRIVMRWLDVKKLAAIILNMEAEAEQHTGDPTAVPEQRVLPSNGKHPGGP